MSSTPRIQPETAEEIIRRITNHSVEDHLTKVGAYVPSVYAHDVDAMRVIADYNGCMAVAGDSRRIGPMSSYQRTPPKTSAECAGECLAAAVDAAGAQGMSDSAVEIYARNGAAVSSATAANLIRMAVERQWSCERVAEDLANEMTTEHMMRLAHAIRARALAR